MVSLNLRRKKLLSATIALFTSMSAGAAAYPGDVSLSPEVGSSAGLQVTATIDGDERDCVGISTIMISETSLTAQEVSRQIPLDNPSPWITLGYLAGMEPVNLRDFFITNYEGVEPRAIRPFTELNGELFVTPEYEDIWANPNYPTGIDPYNLLSHFDRADTDDDGKLTASDVSPLEILRRTYTTSSTDLIYDASSCEGSDQLALLEASRLPLEAIPSEVFGSESATWVNVEEDDELDVALFPGQIAGYSFLATSIGPFGEQQLPLCNEFGPECAPQWAVDLLYRDAKLVRGSSPEEYPYFEWISLDESGVVPVQVSFELFGSGVDFELRTMYWFQLSLMPEGMDLMAVLNYLE